MADSAYGVTRGAASGRYSTALPNNLGAASTWDPQAAFEYGALIGRELRDQGYSMSLGGGVNLPREPRNGRTFEYQGEDPLLAGTLDGNFDKGVQSEHIIGDLKHYAINDQESGRNAVNANIDKRSMRETDLRAFEIALEHLRCRRRHVLLQPRQRRLCLRKQLPAQRRPEEGFPLSRASCSPTGAAPTPPPKPRTPASTRSSPARTFFGDALKKAVESGEVSQDELNDHVHRILRTIFATGLFDNPVSSRFPTSSSGYALAQSIAEKSIVLLKNEHHVLPLEPRRFNPCA